MIGEIQWAIALGCIDIIVATVTMARFRPAPHQDHLKHLKHQEIPEDMPEPFVDATLLHDIPIDWFSKRQNTVEATTYGSEFVADSTAVDQIGKKEQAAEFINFVYIDGKHNLADACTKHTLSCEWYELMKPLTFWHTRNDTLGSHQIDGSDKR
eukprot:3715668-Ditylum_brightwellii.AAC.2